MEIFLAALHLIYKLGQESYLKHKASQYVIQKSKADTGAGRE
jgi:hypothetical protein